MEIKLFVTCEIQYFEIGIFSFNSYVYYLSRGFIVSARAFNLLTRVFNLPTRAFNHETRAFRLPTRGFELVTRVLLFTLLSANYCCKAIHLRWLSWLHVRICLCVIAFEPSPSE